MQLLLTQILKNDLSCVIDFWKPKSPELSLWEVALEHFHWAA